MAAQQARELAEAQAAAAEAAAAKQAEAEAAAAAAEQAELRGKATLILTQLQPQVRSRLQPYNRGTAGYSILLKSLPAASNSSPAGADST